MQSDQNHHIDPIFRHGLENSSAGSPTAEDWNAMRRLMVKEGILKEGRRRRFFYLSFYSLLSAGLITGASIYFTVKNEKEAAASLAEAKIEDQTISSAAQTSELNSALPQATAEPVKTEKKINSQAPSSTHDYPGDVTIRNLTGPNGEGRNFKPRDEEVSQPKSKATDPDAFSVYDKLSKSPPKTVDPAPEISAPKKVKAKKQPKKQNNETGTASSPVKEKASIKSRNKTAADEMPAEPGTGMKNTAGDVTEKAKINSPLIAKTDSTKKPGGLMDTEFTRISPEKDVVDDNFSRFAIGTVASWDMHRYKIVQNTISGQYAPGQIADENLDGENNFSYSAGIMARFRFTYHFMAEAGVLFSQKKQVMYSADNIPGKSDSLKTTTTDFTFHYQARYIDIPLQAKYFIPVGNNFNLQVSAGALFSLSKPFGKNSYYSSVVSDVSGFAPPAFLYASQQPLNIIPYGGIGVNYLYKGKWEMFVEPGFRYGKNPVFKSENGVTLAAEHYLRTFSVEFGCFYNF